MPLLPLQALQPLGYQQPFAQPARQSQGLPALEPEDERSIIERLASPVLGGLGWVGGMLDKYTGSRALRGLLGGKPEEILSIIPGSDFFKLTDPANIVHGTDLWGFDRDQDFFSGENLAGMGLEMLLSPMPGFGGQALTKLGKLAKMKSVLPTNIGKLAPDAAEAAGKKAAATALLQGDDVAKATQAAEAMAQSSRVGGLAPGPQAQALADAMGVPVEQVIGQRLGGHMSLSLPFMGPGLTFDLGPLGRTLDKIPGVGHVGRAIGRGASAVNEKVLRPLFGHQYQGQSNAFGQDLASGATEFQEKLIKQGREARQMVDQELTNRAFKMLGLPDAEWGSQAHRAKVAELEQLMSIRQQTGKAIPDVQDLADQLTALKDEARQGAIGVGVESPALNEIIRGGPVAEKMGVVGEPLLHSPRRRTAETREPMFGGTAGFKLKEGKAREDVYRNMLKEDVEHLRARDDLSGLTMDEKFPFYKNSLERKIGEDYLGFGVKEINERMQGRIEIDRLRKAGKDVPEVLQKRVEELDAVAMQAVELAKMKNGGRITKFGNRLVDDNMTAFVDDVDRRVKGTAVLDGLQQRAKPMSEIEGKAYNLADLLEEAKLNNKEQAGAAKLMEALNNKGYQISDVADLKNFGVDQATADTLMKFVRTGGSSPSFVKDYILPVLDSFTNMWKNAATVLWPGNHMRNQFEAAFQKATTGAFDPLTKNPVTKWTRPWTVSRDLLKSGKSLPDDMAEALFGKGTTGEQATQMLHREVMANNVFNTETRAVRDVAGSVGGSEQGMDALFNRVLGPNKPGFASIAGQAIDPALWKEAGVHGSLLGMQGVAGYTKNVNPWVKAGREMASHLDDVNNLSTYLAKRLQGFDPAAALKETRRAHYDFRMTPFERDVLRRVIPFYSWSKASIPANVKELVTNPSGLKAQTVRAIGGATDKPGFLPAWLQDSVPVGSKDEQGNQSMLAQLGLGFEDLGQLMGNPARDVLGQLNPLLKVPIELGMGKQAFSGRDLRDLHSKVGDITGTAPPPIVEELLMNSPLARPINFGATALDARKGPLAALTNLMTGVRLQDVNVPRIEQSGLEARVADMLKDYPQLRRFERTYLPRGTDPALLPPQALELLQLQSMLQRRRQEQAR